MKISTKHSVFLILLGALLYSEAAYAQLGSFLNRKAFDIDADSVSGSTDLTDFPILFSFTDAQLADVPNGGLVQNSNGYDIAFSTGDGTTALDFELES